MKRFNLQLVAVLLLAAGSAATAHAQGTLYWDINGADPGAGQIDGFTDGVWGTDSFWSTDPNGAVATGPWTAGDHAVFSAGNDAMDAFIDVTGTQTAASVTIEDGTVFIASGIVDTGAGNVTVGPGATLRIESILRFPTTVTGRVVLNNGTLWQSNPGFAGSFLRATQSVEINGTGTIDRTALNTDNSEPVEPPARRINIYTVNASNAIVGTGGTPTNGGAGTLIKTGPDEFRYQGAGLPLTSYAKLVVEEGLFRLGFNTVDVEERGFGAVPLSVLPDAITLNGGFIAHSFNATTLHANRGITIGPNGGGWAGGIVTVPGPLSGSGLLTVSGGTFILTNAGNAGTFSGKIHATAGTIAANSNEALGEIPTSPVADSITLGTATAVGTLRLDTTMTLDPNRGITLVAGTGGGQLSTATSAVTATYNGVITGGGNLTKTGLGTWVLGGTNTYTGITTTFGGGVLSVSSEANLGTTPAAPVATSITLAGATTGGTLLTTADISLSPNRGVFLNPGQPTATKNDPATAVGGTLDVASGTTLTVPGVISGTAAATGESGTPPTPFSTGPGRLTKIGAGTLVVSGANTYTGSTTINAGTLLANNTSGSGTGTGAVNVNNNGTLGGTGSVAGLVTVNTGGAVAPGAGGIGTLTAAGGLTLNTGSILNFDLGAPTMADLLNVTGGTTTINGGSLNLNNVGGLANGTYTLIDYTGALAGSAANLALGTTPAGFNFSIVDSGSTIDLMVSTGGGGLDGDYNMDGKVDAADYVVWRKDPSAHGGDPDGYNTWRTNFGRTAGSGSGSSLGAGAVPEPSAIALLLLGLMAGAVARRKR
jgi:autotransporter-associated beta strand protein